MWLLIKMGRKPSCINLMMRQEQAHMGICSRLLEGQLKKKKRVHSKNLPSQIPKGSESFCPPRN